MNPDGLTHSNECIDQFEKLLKGSPADVGDSMKVGTSCPSVMVDTSKGGVGSDVFGDVAQGSFGGGVKRPLERSGEASDDSYMLQAYMMKKRLGSRVLKMLKMHR